jgi:hypothetical protein
MKTHSSKELYEVSFDYQMDDGYWSCGNKELVSVQVMNSDDEKNNHSEAASIISNRYENCEITKVEYC